MKGNTQYFPVFVPPYAIRPQEGVVSVVCELVWVNLSVGVVVPLLITPWHGEPG